MQPATVSEALERDKPQETEVGGAPPPGRHCGGQMWVQTRFQKQMSNYISLSEVRGESTLQPAAGKARADPRVQVPGHLSLQKCYHWSQNRLV